eukprot:15353736-Ditylum_brightwellii.AAC.1
MVLWKGPYKLYTKCGSGKNKKIVAHCTYGMGLSGRIAARWLSVWYGLSTKDTTTEALDTAQMQGMQRMSHQKVLEAWIEH